ncbi:hypothetical protein E4U42_006533 [Claviceps africana]|uniref:RRM domain-containing protein n=1 Tax=Claviceps africana TaxID=83212 RepID=A0A8K0NGN1_9HYPO|nr:hypothetical protein E4U42_006533 [Claviceps africana]
MKSAANLARRRITPRSIRVLVSPVPVTFAERRSVLQVLEQYGPVEVFQMAPGQHANFISVTKEEATAKKLVDSSPLVYRMPPPLKQTDIDVADLVVGDISNAFNTESTRPSVLDASQEQSATNDDDKAALGDGFTSAFEQQQNQQQQAAQFKLDIFPEPNYHHEFAMSRSPLHYSWPTTYDRDQSFATSILKHSLPQTIASEGLAHWLLEPGCCNPNKITHGKYEREQLRYWLPTKMTKSDAE